MIKILACATLALTLAASASARPLGIRTVSVPAITVPEPASWVLMLTGVFGVGVALRRRSPAVG